MRTISLLNVGPPDTIGAGGRTTRCREEAAITADAARIATTGSIIRLSMVRIITPMALHVVLVHPEIHWNTGNAGRSCLAAGATLHLVEPLGFSLDEREVRRAGLDYWEHVDLRTWPDWESFEAALPQLGEPFFFSTKATTLFWDVPLGAPRDVVL